MAAAETVETAAEVLSETAAITATHATLAAMDAAAAAITTTAATATADAAQTPAATTAAAATADAAAIRESWKTNYGEQGAARKKSGPSFVLFDGKWPKMI